MYLTISHISHRTFLTLCKAVSGSGNSKRALYTVDGVFISKFKRCIGINGINIVTNRPDLIDRSLILKVERIPDSKRKKEEVIKREFERLRPYVLGYIFDMLVKVLNYREEHSGKTELANSLRMADFAEWAETISRCLGYPEYAILNAYQKNIDNLNDEIIESIPVADTLITFMEDKDDWDGTPTELCHLLGDIISQIDSNIKRSKYWPKAANRLTAILNEILQQFLYNLVRILLGRSNKKS